MEKLTLETITAEDICAKLMPTVWPYTKPNDRERERWLHEAQRYLDTIRQLVDTVRQ
jgi:hypothetical protein